MIDKGFVLSIFNNNLLKNKNLYLINNGNIKQIENNLISK